MISLVPSESWGGFKWVRASARKWGVGPCPAQCVWQGSGFAADQTNAMLAVGGTSCISLVSVAAADENSLTPLHRLLPTETASLGFGGSPVGGGDKSSRFAFSAFPCGGGITTLWPLCLCRNNPARGLFQQKKRLSQSGCSAPTNALFTLAHSAFSAFLHGGWYHYPRRALHAVETLDAHGSRRRICRFCAAAVLALCGQNISSSGTHATPAPNRVHSGLQGETRRVLRVDGDDVSGSGIIDTIDPFQADQTAAVALAEGHRNAVSP